MSLPKIAIFGATGQQGRSIVNTLHTHSILSRQFSLRAITRSASSPTALILASQGIEIVEADLDDPSTLPSALANTHTVVLITLTIYDPQIKTREYAQTRNVADAAVAAGAHHIIYSTAVNCQTLWPANLTPRAVHAFESKAEAELYLRTLPIRVSYFAPGCFMQNFTTFFGPRRQGDGSYVMVNVVDKDAKIPLIDIEGDSGTFVASLLLRGEAGETMYASGGLYSFEEIVGVISKVSGKEVKYVQVPEEVFKGFMSEEQGGRIVNMMKWFEEVGYFGPRTRELVEESSAKVQGKLTSFEEFAERNFVELE
ncbi:HSCARG dehydrogenase [Aspergillus steynii IBT 23096]|uniref:HSCARG dehydrogenase n=1 Tax=Aspergillus steynii IBT 23096 TaxID=1392250 RepID=A0A2I2G480_9EURO|nr:HSCARG dehydrogenase [Aspergillus steynii IBT 23096]PLB47678.1 HSCARG dehydrogenase [Aspergillus steynii IBT 23096]